MKRGDEVIFFITGMTGRYKGTVELVAGKYGQPELRVTHSQHLKGDPWVEEEDEWLILKDGDYILLEDKNPVLDPHDNITPINL